MHARAAVCGLSLTGVCISLKLLAHLMSGFQPRQNAWLELWGDWCVLQFKRELHACVIDERPTRCEASSPRQKAWLELWGRGVVCDAHKA